MNILEVGSLKDSISKRLDYGRREEYFISMWEGLIGFKELGAGWQQYLDKWCFQEIII